MAAGSSAASQAQQRTARLSVVAALFLVALKLVTGLITGSLGLIAEAAHSGTDVVAALLTVFAIRVAVRPADAEHHYGHGKAEHLAALAESSFLILVSLFLAYQGIARLASSTPHHVDATWWSFAVLAVVIAVDATRATMSMRASRRFHSAALASNALHFASDLGGSVAVLIGLILVSAGEPKADAIAALIVAVLVMVAAGRLAAASVRVLMDTADVESAEAIRRAIAQLEVPVEVRRVRVRHAAGRDFVDLVVAVSADAGLVQAHSVSELVEQAVRSELPGADVIVHVESAEAEGDLRERATAAALGLPGVREVHNVRVMHLGDATYEVSLHVKLPRNLLLGEAHAVVEELEHAVLEAVPEVSAVHTHIEPLARTDWASTPDRDAVSEEREAIAEVVREHTGHDPAALSFRDGEAGRVVFIEVLLPAEQPLPSAHRRAGSIEEAVRARCPDLADVVVHTEPVGAGS
ncbi:MAG: cation diffusion facilitator family transporter [Solirubrobacteraceae bacterium]